MWNFKFLQKAETAGKEKSRASAVAINAEIRRTKARLLEEVPKLQRLAIKKVVISFYNIPFSFVFFIFYNFLISSLIRK